MSLSIILKVTMYDKTWLRLLWLLHRKNYIITISFSMLINTKSITILFHKIITKLHYKPRLIKLHKISDI